MTPRAFFYLVAQMRAAQREYFETRNPLALRASIAAEREVDQEIARVREVMKNEGR